MLQAARTSAIQRLTRRLTAEPRNSATPDLMLGGLRTVSDNLRRGSRGAALSVSNTESRTPVAHATPSVGWLWSAGYSRLCAHYAMELCTHEEVRYG